MKSLFIDPFAGVAGDMFVGAILDLAQINDNFWSIVKGLNLPKLSLRDEKVLKAGISSTKFCVETKQGLQFEPHADIMYSQNFGYHHSHAGDGATGAHSHEHSHRSYKEVVRLIGDLEVDEKVKTDAKAVFKLIGEAEAEIHGKTLESIHFHEVGAWDAIADIVCACLAMDLLKVDKVICRPIALGGGTVKAAHGIMPVPAPATALLLKGLPTFGGPVQRELTTPTGAALLKYFVDDYSENCSGIIEEIGYGAGSLEFKTHANALKVTLYSGHGIGNTASEEDDSLRSQGLGTRQEARGGDDSLRSQGQGMRDMASEEADWSDSLSGFDQDEVAVIDFSIDDQTAEQISFYADRLIELGALDVYRQSALSKKGRQTSLFTVLCQREDFEKLAKKVLLTTGTLGFRYLLQKRYKFKRKLIKFHSSFGQISVKVRGYKNEVLGFKPEFDDCRKIAVRKNLNLNNLCQEIHCAFESAIATQVFDELPDEIYKKEN